MFRGPRWVSEMPLALQKSRSFSLEHLDQPRCDDSTNPVHSGNPLSLRKLQTNKITFALKNGEKHCASGGHLGTTWLGSYVCRFSNAKFSRRDSLFY